MKRKGFSLVEMLIVIALVGVLLAMLVPMLKKASELRIETEAVAQEEKPLNLVFSSAFVVFPQDCNANPPMVFGGKLLSEMDRCAGVAARRLLYASPTGAKDAVTVGINNVVFHKSAEIKDLVFVTGTIVRTGGKSITIKVIAEKETSEKRELLLSADFTFCAFDLNAKKAIEHGISKQ